MAKPYATYFDNPFEALRMARPAYKAQAAYSLRAVRQAELGAAFTKLLAELETAIDSFDENLTDRQQPTGGDTDAYQLARKEWLEFVDDVMKDHLTPKLRKQSVYTDFKKFGKSRLSHLDQNDLLIQSQELVKLYANQQKTLDYLALADEAAKKLKKVADADETRDEHAAATDTTILDLATDRAAIARAQRRLKAQLELTFDEPDKVYSFFDFSQASAARQASRKAKKKASKQQKGSADSTEAGVASQST